MSYLRKNRDEHLASDDEPKRILALDGGGLRGIVSIAFLQKIEELMADCASLQETMLQWLSDSPTARVLDRELGSLAGDLVAPTPLMTYLRYDLDLRPESVQTLKPSLANEAAIASLTEMDAPKNMGLLHELATLAASGNIDGAHLPETFDLTSPERA